MHRITRENLAAQLAVAITMALRRCKPLLRPNRLPQESDELSDFLAQAALAVVDSDTRMVIQTETYGETSHGGWQGKWGIDEPDPTMLGNSDVQSLRK